MTILKTAARETMNSLESEMQDLELNSLYDRQPVASHADVLRGSAGFGFGGTRDEPLRTSAWEAR